jgi:hypothetical protein
MAAIKTESGQIGWRFGLRWVLLTIAGLIIGFVVGFVFGEIGLGYIGTETIMAAIVGLMQWLVLRRFVKIGGFWILANIIGFAISSSIHSVAIYIWKLPEDLGIPLAALGWTIAFVLGAAISGILQYRLLRQHFQKSFWWVPANAAGWGLCMAGMGIIILIFNMMKSGQFIILLLREVVAPLLMLFIPSVILGIITAVTLIWLMRCPILQMANPSAS